MNGLTAVLLALLGAWLLADAITAIRNRNAHRPNSLKVAP
jgi:hypothetical protein